MKKQTVLSYVAAFLFALAAVLSFYNGNVFRGVIGLIGGISFVLAGIHWKSKS